MVVKRFLIVELMRLVFLLLVICEGREVNTATRGRPPSDVTRDEGIRESQQTQPGSESAANSKSSTATRDTSNRLMTAHSRTRTGSTRNGQKVTVKHWYLSHNGKPVDDGTSQTSSSSSSASSSSSISRGHYGGQARQQSNGHGTAQSSSHRGTYPGRHTYRSSSSRAYVPSRVVPTNSRRILPTSGRRVGERKRVIPRTTSVLRQGPIRRSRTYVYPFTEQAHQPTYADGSSDSRVRARVPTGNAHSSSHSTRGRLPYVTHSGSVRGSKTEALTSGVNTHQQHTASSHTQANHRGEQPSSSRQPQVNQRGEHPSNSRQPQVNQRGEHPSSSHQPQVNQREEQPSSSRQPQVNQRGEHPSNSRQPQVKQRGELPSSLGQPTREQTRYSSNSSLVHSLNRHRATQRNSWGRVNDPSRFNNRNNARRTLSSGTYAYNPRQPYSPRGNINRASLTGQVSDGSRTNPSTRQVFNPNSGNTLSSQGSRRTRFPSQDSSAHNPQSQRVYRRNRLANGYGRNSGHYQQRHYYPDVATSGNVFTSYDVTDDGECPNTGIDLRINGLNCQQAVQNYGQYLCYAHEYTSKQCCETCLQRKRPEQVGCEYGDHARLCSSITPSDCYDRRNELSCCQTCTRFKKIGVPETCQWGDMIGSQRCDEVRRNPGLCYMPDNARLCCETCSHMKNNSNPTCSWGDQNARMCQIFGPTGDVLINCYSPYRRRMCCQSCDRLKDWLPDTMPENCEYGDRPVIFTTGQFGRINCAQLLQHISVDECRTNPVVSRNCCYTCQRYMNSSSSSSSSSLSTSGS